MENLLAYLFGIEFELNWTTIQWKFNRIVWFSVRFLSNFFLIFIISLFGNVFEFHRYFHYLSLIHAQTVTAIHVDALCFACIFHYVFFRYFYFSFLVLIQDTCLFSARCYFFVAISFCLYMRVSVSVSFASIEMSRWTTCMYARLFVYVNICIWFDLSSIG